MNKEELIETAAATMEGRGCKILATLGQGPVNLLALDPDGTIRAVEVLFYDESASCRSRLEQALLDAYASIPEPPVGKIEFDRMTSSYRQKLFLIEQDVLARSDDDEDAPDRGGNGQDAGDLHRRACEAARKSLESKGYEILASGYRHERGRIDFVALDPDQGDVAMIEVLPAPQEAEGFPSACCDPGKAEAVRRFASAWACSHDRDEDHLRFDIVTVGLLSGNLAFIRHRINAIDLGQKIARTVTDDESLNEPAPTPCAG